MIQLVSMVVLMTAMVVAVTADHDSSNYDKTLVTVAMTGSGCGSLWRSVVG